MNRTTLLSAASRIPSKNQRTKFKNLYLSDESEFSLSSLLSNFNAITIRQVCRSLFTFGEEDLFSHFAKFSDVSESTDFGKSNSRGALECLIERLENRLEDVEKILTTLEACNRHFLEGETVALRLIFSLCDSFGCSIYLLKKTMFFLGRHGIVQSKDAETITAELEKFGLDEMGALTFHLSEYFYDFANTVKYQEEFLNHFASESAVFSSEDIYRTCCLPIPTTEGAVESYVKKLVGFGFVDQVVGLRCLMLLAERSGWKSVEAATVTLSHELKSVIFSDRSTNPKKLIDFVRDFDSEGDSSLAVYSVAPAFLEDNSLMQFRNYCDYLTVNFRKDCSLSQHRRSAQDQLNQSQLKDLVVEGALKGWTWQIEPFFQPESSFCRTILLLDYFARYPADNNFLQTEILKILENTMDLNILLSKSKILKLKLRASSNNNQIGSLLWSILLISESFDEDAEHDVIFDFETLVIRDFKSNYAKFVEEFSEDYPNIASTIINTLGPRRLMKSYDLVKSYVDLVSIRKELLSVGASISGNIDLLVESDALTFDLNLSKIRNQFDKSRVYADEEALKRWLKREFSDLFILFRKRYTARWAAQNSGNPISDEEGKQSIHYYVLRPMQKIYEKFCLDSYFGVDSYLGRRVRHNSINGLLESGLQELATSTERKYKLDAAEIDMFFAEALKSIRLEIEFFSANKVQFCSTYLPEGLLSSRFLESEEESRLLIPQINKLAGLILTSSPELVHSQILELCWLSLSEKLKKARHYIRGTLYHRLDQILVEACNNTSRPPGVLELKREIRTLLAPRIERLALWFEPFNPNENAFSFSEVVELAWNEAMPNSRRGGLVVLGSAKDARVLGLELQIFFDCVDVLLNNASFHGKEGGDVEVSIDYEKAMPPDSLGSTRIVNITTSVKSEIGCSKSGNEKISALEKAFLDKQASSEDLVREGYSGIPKLHFLVSQYSSAESPTYSIDEEKLSIEFQLRMNVLGQCTQ